MYKTLTAQITESHQEYYQNEYLNKPQFAHQRDVIGSNGYLKMRPEWCDLPRASDTTKSLSPKAILLISDLAFKFNLSNQLVIDYEEIKDITRTSSQRQNRRYLQELSDIIEWTFHQSIIIDNKKYRDALIIRFTKNGKNILRGEINDNIIEMKKLIIDEQTDKNVHTHGHFCPPHIYSTDARLINLNKKNIADEASFLNSENQEEDLSKIIPITDYIPKSLEQYHPLTEEDAIELRKRSRRPFNLRYINMLLIKCSEWLKMHPPIPAYNGLFTRKGVITYMTGRLIAERRDAELTNLETFKFKKRGNITKCQNEFITQIVAAQSELWEKAMPQLIEIYGEPHWNSWLSKCEAHQEDGKVIVMADSLFVIRWISDNYSPGIEKVISELLPDIDKKNFDWIQYRTKAKIL